jgi:serine/threonine protein kinase
MSAPNFPAGHVFKDTYQVGRRLGAGGMGVVYEVTHLRVGRRLALKVLNPRSALDDQMVARFRREAQAAGRIGHPNIVAMVDFDQTADGIPFLVMELVEGESLERVLAREGALDVHRAVALVEQVAAALQAAHEQAVIHRDLKPENIMICREGKREVVKVLDFGLAKVLDAALTLTRKGTTFGTPRYMSPEQAMEASAVDARSDIFSLGAVTYHLLAGRPPFQGANNAEVLASVMDDEPPNLAELRPGLPAAVIAAVERALRKKPEERFPSAAEFAAALEQAAASTPTPEEPAGSTGPADRTGRSGDGGEVDERSGDGGEVDDGRPSLAETGVRPARQAPPPDEELAKTDLDSSPEPTSPRIPTGMVVTAERRPVAPVPGEAASPHGPRAASTPLRSTAARLILLAVAFGVGLAAAGTWLVLRSSRPPGPAASTEGPPRPRRVIILAAGPAVHAPDSASRRDPRDAAIPGLRPPASTRPSAATRREDQRLATASRRPLTKKTAHGGPDSALAEVTPTGTLVITASDDDGPVAPEIRVDGRPYPCCPARVSDLVVGRAYTLGVECPGYRAQRREIRITQGGESKIHLQLEPLKRSHLP